MKLRTRIIISLFCFDVVRPQSLMHHWRSSRYRESSIPQGYSISGASDDQESAPDHNGNGKRPRRDTNDDEDEQRARVPSPLDANSMYTSNVLIRGKPN